MTHTPGPWRIDLHGDHNEKFAIEGQAFDGSWKWIADRVRGGSKGQTIANAKLIAAAPELLNALKSAASTAHYRGTFRGASEFCHGTFEECTNCQIWKDVIAKAEAVSQ